MTFKDVTSISIGRLIAKIKEYASNAASFVYPIPVKIVNRITAPAPGAAGVPIEEINAKIAMIAMDVKVTSYPALIATNKAAITA